MTSSLGVPPRDKEESSSGPLSTVVDQDTKKAETAGSIVLTSVEEKLVSTEDYMQGNYVIPSNSSTLQESLELIKVSIIIANGKGREEYLKRCLGSIIDTNTSHRVELLVSSEGNLSSCRNTLAAKANGSILIFFDDDVELRNNTINELVSPFLNGDFKNVGIVGGCNIAFQDAEQREKLGNKLLGNYLATFKSSARYCPKGNVRMSDEAEIVACNMAILKKAYVEAGGFPEDIIPCEENVLINKIQALGYSVVYNPFAVVYHRQPKLFKQYARQIFSYGKGRGVMLRKHEGKSKILSRPSKDSFMLAAGLVVHYAAYLSGVVYGYFRAGSPKYRKRSKPKKQRSR